jgi:hypothetical protein
MSSGTKPAEHQVGEPGGFNLGVGPALADQ